MENIVDFSNNVMSPLLGDKFVHSGVRHLSVPPSVYLSVPPSACLSRSLSFLFSLPVCLSTHLSDVTNPLMLSGIERQQTSESLLLCYPRNHDYPAEAVLPLETSKLKTLFCQQEVVKLPLEFVRQLSIKVQHHRPGGWDKAVF